MDCIICGNRIVNENNRLQNKVRDFFKKNRQLDLKHQWIKEWKICYGCSEKYTNDMLASDKVKNHKSTLNRSFKQQKKEQVPPESFRDHYVQRYIEYATDKSEKNGSYAIKQKNLRNQQSYDEAYIAYLERSESVAVIIVRDLIKTIDTKDRWVDVRMLERRFLSDLDRDFSFIIVELFQRKLKPNYPKKKIEDTDFDYKNLKAYITWKTATADINSQRANGIKGDVYIILPRLKNEHEGKYEKHFILWEPIRLVFKRVRIGKQYVNVVKPPKWSYEIVATEKINHHQLNYIENNLDKIIGKTHTKRGVTLSIFKPHRK
ncbi:hypothetical protein [Bacillus sp. PS06]|uniref:hypothetical protein n=1 Tax=Bacillus sp. PS06 TaxID=2764176 RepID=UPI001782CF52|nr:hypothetical protein [Bacillus sp. PS06]MBD8068795.1 hypothetical protein [Bacillus sp. PS06]